MVLRRHHNKLHARLFRNVHPLLGVEFIRFKEISGLLFIVNHGYKTSSHDPFRSDAFTLTNPFKLGMGAEMNEQIKLVMVKLFHVGPDLRRIS